MSRAANVAAMRLLRPYIRRELPGWGRLYGSLVGDFRSDERWRDAGQRWMRGKLHGYEMLLDLGNWSNRSTFFLGRFYDLPTQLALAASLREGDTFVDIGANEGMISLLAARLVGPAGKVIAFEPNPRPRSVFQAAINRNRIGNVDLRPLGLSDSAGVLQLTVPKVNSGEGSFGRPDYDPASVDLVECSVQVGDQELREARPRLLKIDVEGFELHVLRGLEQTIARCRPAIVMEMVTQHLVNAGSSIAEVVSFMTDRGYTAQQTGLTKRHGRQVLQLREADFSGNVYGDFLWTHAARSHPGRASGHETM